MSIRVRFAPSPSGNLHLGGARTALYNILLATQQGGVHVLRVEDTDESRSAEEYRTGLLEAMEWLGLRYDEGPHYQVGWHLGDAFMAQRKAHYRAYAQRLEDSGHAYWQDDPEKGRALLFTNPGGRVEWDDAVHGASGRDTTDDPDLVLLKSSGWPTYNFACVVDDIDMRITHVLRGDDHLSNTPKQLVLYRALGAEPPVFAHLPLILTPDGKKMSKDFKKKGKGDVELLIPTHVRQYRDLGYTPEALLNYLALLGWSAGDDREIMTPQEMTGAFSLDRVKSTGARFDIDKLQWMNGEYLRAWPAARLQAAVAPFLEAAGLDPAKNSLELAQALTGKCKTLAEYPEKARFCLQEAVEWNPKAVRKFLRPDSVPAIQAARDALAAVDLFTREAIEAALTPVIEAHGGIKKAGQLIRVSATGTNVSPELFATCALVGQDRLLARFDASLAQAAIAAP